jgi:hypothetical protein
MIRGETMEKKIEISFRYADWMVKRIENGMKGTRNPDLYNGMLKVWKEFRSELCDHEMVEIDDNYPFCHKCGFDDLMESEPFEVNCHNCKHLEIDGGDWVPYGMGSTQLPTNHYCMSPVIVALPEIDYDNFSEKDHRDCKHWEGKL